MTSINDRLDRTRAFFKFDSWSMDAADAWQHVLNGACDDDDLNGDKSFSALDMPRPDDYTVADVLTKVTMYTRMYIEDKMERETQENYCFGDLDHKKRTESDYWRVIKLVLEQIEVIAK